MVEYSRRAWLSAGVVAYVAVSCCLGVVRGQEAGVGLTAPHFPPAASVDLVVTSHLVDPSASYPPAVRKLRLDYDRDAGVARIIEGNSTYVRRFRDKREYKVRGGEFPLCQQSYLGESLPRNFFPRGGMRRNTVACPFIGYQSQRCAEWVFPDGSEQEIVAYLLADVVLPIGVRVFHTPPGGDPSPIITYEWRSITLGPPAPQLFEAPTAGRECEVVRGGFGWMHLFHFFFRL